MCNNLIKLAIVSLSVVSLVATVGSSGGSGGGGTGGGGTGGGGTGGTGTGGGTGAGIPVVVGTPLKLLNPNKALGSYSESSDDKTVSADLTFRANSAFFKDGAYAKVQGHELKAKYGHTEVGNATSYNKKKGAFTGILSSATEFITLNEAAKNLSAAELTELTGLRADIATLENDISTKPGDSDILEWKESLKNKLGEIAGLISYGGLQVSLRPLASGNGFYGLFVNNDNGDYKQLSGVYALKSGKSVADYNALQGGGGTTSYHVKFSGAAAISGIQLIDLKSRGLITDTVTANFDSQTLTGDFKVSNTANTETGNISFSGAMSKNVGGKTGLIFGSNGASYASTTGSLGNMTGGNAEAALIDGGNSILGSVNITGGGNAVVGAFGGDK